MEKKKLSETFCFSKKNNSQLKVFEKCFEFLIKSAHNFAKTNDICFFFYIFVSLSKMTISTEINNGPPIPLMSYIL